MFFSPHFPNLFPTFSDLCPLDGQDLAGPGLGDRPAKRRKAEVAEVQLLQIIKKHSGSRLANQPSPLWGV